MSYRDELEAARSRTQALEEKLEAQQAEIEALRRAAAAARRGAPSAAVGGHGVTRQIVAGTLLLSFFTSGFLLVTREPRAAARKRVVTPVERVRGAEVRVPARDPRARAVRPARGEACSTFPDQVRASP